MKTAIVYASVHHGNTKKIIDEIAKTNDVELIDATQTVEKDPVSYTHLQVCEKERYSLCKDKVHHVWNYTPIQSD